MLSKWFKENIVQAKPYKFQVIAVGNKMFEKNPSTKNQQFILSCEEIVELLGTDIDY